MSLVDNLIVSLGEKALGTKDFKDVRSITLAKAHLVDSVQAAKKAGFEMISDIFGIDYLNYPKHQGKRFTVVYNLYSIANNERIFIRVDLDDAENLPTITHIWRGANFMEREVYDMFGIVFDDHPDLRRILTPDSLEGHAHRKDFPLGETPTLFNKGRFLDPETFRSGLTGKDKGLTGWKGGSRKGVKSGKF